MMFGMGWDGFGRVLGIFFGGGWGVIKSQNFEIFKNVRGYFSHVGKVRNSIFSQSLNTNIGQILIKSPFGSEPGPAAGGEALRIIEMLLQHCPASQKSIVHTARILAFHFELEHASIVKRTFH